jgi:hypothetical protein
MSLQRGREGVIKIGKMVRRRLWMAPYVMYLVVEGRKITIVVE